ncbi:MAG: phosphoribosylanthranilate isomerase [Paludibacteraceae bacterium]|nr:phosphoribosylanthranilate isomerase [Paludibacteraceae bacterium]
MKPLLIKVCGMRDDTNICQLRALTPDFMGLICHPGSPRYVGLASTAIQGASWSPVQKVGVFVNASVDEMLAYHRAFGFNCIQLHGHETPEDCEMVRLQTGCRVLKAISVSGRADVERAESYCWATDYLLFDTHCTDFGGSGKTFDWSLLDHYQGTTPFFISGGLGEQELSQLLGRQWPKWVGVDLNSRFETAPALKDIARLKKVIEQLRKQ